jgi:hypothetical protein
MIDPMGRKETHSLLFKEQNGSHSGGPKKFSDGLNILRFLPCVTSPPSIDPFVLTLLLLTVFRIDLREG